MCHCRRVEYVKLGNKKPAVSCVVKVGWGMLQRVGVYQGVTGHLQAQRHTVVRIIR